MLFEHHDLKPRNPHLGLALDESLCLHLARQQDTLPFWGGLRFWSSPYSIILGRTCRPEKSLRFLSSLQAQNSKMASNPEKLPLCRRLSGGGTILHGPGNLNYSIFLSLHYYPQMFSLEHSYATLLDLVTNALQAQGFPCRREGQSDIVLVEKGGVLRKISGNAQFRRRGVLVLHGTLVIRRELITMIKKYLSHPLKEPSYRAGRKHSDFMGHLPTAFDFAAFYNCFSKYIQELGGPQNLMPLTTVQRYSVYSLALRLARKQYMHAEWILKGQNVRSLRNEKNAWELNPASFQPNRPKNKKQLA